VGALAAGVALAVESVAQHAVEQPDHAQDVDVQVMGLAFGALLDAVAPAVGVSGTGGSSPTVLRAATRTAALRSLCMSSPVE
jgi:hypothetical protein